MPTDIPIPEDAMDVESFTMLVEHLHAEAERERNEE